MLRNGRGRIEIVVVAPYEADIVPSPRERVKIKEQERVWTKPSLTNYTNQKLKGP